MSLLTIQHLSLYFGKHCALQDLNLTLAAGEILGLVGESGSGKSSLARAVMGLLPFQQGQILVKGQSISQVRGRELKSLRRQVQMIFQDPYSSLNPRRTVGQTLLEPRQVHGLDCQGWVDKLLQQVGLLPEHACRYPHQFSGGQRQRIALARALACQPELLVADEAVSALDVSVQAQIINLLCRLQQELGLAILFISHDLAVVRQMCQRVAVLYRGQLVEWGPAEVLCARPRHPYSAQLLASVPGPQADFEASLAKGPGSLDRSQGCRFAPCCSRAQQACWQQFPPKQELAEGHEVYCYHPL